LRSKICVGEITKVSDDGVSAYEGAVFWIVLRIKSVDGDRWENGFEREDNRLLPTAL
jgi:hypothetical protein